MNSPNKTPEELSAALLTIGKAVVAVNGNLPAIEPDTPRWRAWREWRVRHGLSVKIMDRREQFTVPLEWPPVDIEAALKEWTDKSQKGGKVSKAIKEMRQSCTP